VDVLQSERLEEEHW